MVGKDIAQGKIAITCLTGRVISITGNPPPLSNQTGATFTFTADRPATFECSVDGGSFTACASPFDITGPLGESGHTFAVHGIDTLGTYGDDAAYGWTVDITAPSVTLNQAVSQLDPSN